MANNPHLRTHSKQREKIILREGVRKVLKKGEGGSGLGVPNFAKCVFWPKKQVFFIKRVLSVPTEGGGGVIHLGRIPKKYHFVYSFPYMVRWSLNFQFWLFLYQESA